MAAPTGQKTSHQVSLSPSLALSLSLLSRSRTLSSLQISLSFCFLELIEVSLPHISSKPFLKGLRCHSVIEEVVSRGSIVLTISGVTSLTISFHDFISAFFFGPTLTRHIGDGGEKDNCNYDNYANSPHAITVAFHSKDGAIPKNAEPCAAAVRMWRERCGKGKGEREKELM